MLSLPKAIPSLNVACAPLPMATELYQSVDAFVPMATLSSFLTTAPLPMTILRCAPITPCVFAPVPIAIESDELPPTTTPVPMATARSEGLAFSFFTSAPLPIAMDLVELYAIFAFLPMASPSSATTDALSPNAAPLAPSTYAFAPTAVPRSCFTVVLAPRRTASLTFLDV